MTRISLRGIHLASLLLAIGALGPPAFAQSSQGDSSAAQTQMSPADKSTADRVYNALNRDDSGYYRHVTVTASGGVVTLGGFVTGERSQSKAKQIASGVQGVSKVIDQTQLQPEGEQGKGTK